MRGMDSTHNGPRKAGKARQQDLAPSAAAAGAPASRSKPAGVPENLPEIAEVRLIDGKAAAQVGGMSTSWWYEMVAKGVAPPPLFRAPRCTRWRLSDVVAFWRDWRPAEPAADVVAVAKRASARARERRRAALRAVEGGA